MLLQNELSYVADEIKFPFCLRLLLKILKYAKV